MFKKLYLMGASPPHWPGAGPGHPETSKLILKPLTPTALKENENGH